MIVSSWSYKDGDVAHRVAKVRLNTRHGHVDTEDGAFACETVCGEQLDTNELDLDPFGRAEVTCQDCAG